MTQARTIEVEVEVADWTRAAPDVGGVVRRAAEAALQEVGAGGEVAVLLTGDAEVRLLNGRFRSKAEATNVLAFPAGDGAVSPDPDAVRPLGDVALAFGVCAEEAGLQGKPLEAHLAHLVVHGVLHLLGYDHEADAGAEAMEGLERVILARLGWPDPYAAERVPPP